MAGEQGTTASGSDGGVDARIAANEARIASLQDQVDLARRRSIEDQTRADEDRGRIGVLEDRADMDAVLITELQADGLVHREQTANLALALRTSRTIGAAVGILMSRHHLGEEQAFQLLKKASMDSNRKLREVAGQVVETGELTSQPH